MGKFIIGTVLGVALAFGYVRYHVSLPAVLQFPQLLSNFFVAGAVDSDLYDLDRDVAHRKRALEVLFQAQPKWAVDVDAEFGHPFMALIYRRQVMRRARALKMQWEGYDKGLAEPGLRRVLERRYTSSDPEVIKARMLLDAFRKSEFLAAWAERRFGIISEANVKSIIDQVSKRPQQFAPLDRGIDKS